MRLYSSRLQKIGGFIFMNSLQVKQILGCYSSENTGVQTQLARLLNHGYLAGTGKLVILPVDQGFEHGPLQSFAGNQEACDPDYHFKLAIAAGCNAYAAPFGFLQASADKFAGEVPLILKANNSDSLYKNAEAPIPALTAQIDSALQLGCVAVGFTIYPGSSERKQMYEEVAKASEYARKYGLAVVIWSYPRGKGVSKKGETALDVVTYAAHIAAQLGAHIIKVKPPSDFLENPALKDLLKGQTDSLSARVQVVIQSAFNGKRIVIFSGGPAKEKEAVLKEIQELATGGSFGSIVGRNAFKRPYNEGVSLLKEIMDIYKKASGYTKSSFPFSK